ncbi:MAG: PhoH family protein [Chlamydiota bacterium]
MSDKKTFVLDTNVLLHDPNALQEFPNSNLVIPLTVLEELESMKKYTSELGHNARRVIRYLDFLKNVGDGNLHRGVKIDNGSTIRIQVRVKSDFPIHGVSKKNIQIIMAAYLLQEEGQRVVFVSKDIAARVKAQVIGLEAEDYEKLKVSYGELYQGYREVEVSKKEIDLLYKDGAIEPMVEGLSPHEYCYLKTSDNNSSAISRFCPKSKKLVSVSALEQGIWGVKPYNIQQRCALDLVLNDDINLVTLEGPAGTGKTLLALAGGVHKVFDEGTYKRILVSRPIVPLGKDIGYLPGSKEEKLVHWMQPIYDNLGVICDTSGEKTNETMEWIVDSNKFEIEAVTYIRGRSLPKMYMIIDEAQNLTPHDVKTIISRAGMNTKVILTGDPSQIDNPYLDQDSNGLTFTVERFREHGIAGHISLSTTERSPLAALAANIM